MSAEEVAQLPERPEEALTRYELVAPIGGIIVERGVTEGEVLNEDPAEPPFIVADLSQVWVQLTVYPKDLKLKEIRQALPEGVEIVPYYEQKTLVDASVHTVTRALLEGVVPVVLVLLVFMGAYGPVWRWRWRCLFQCCSP